MKIFGLVLDISERKLNKYKGEVAKALMEMEEGDSLFLFSEKEYALSNNWVAAAAVFNYVPPKTKFPQRFAVAEAIKFLKNQDSDMERKVLVVTDRPEHAKYNKGDVGLKFLCIGEHPEMKALCEEMNVEYSSDNITEELAKDIRWQNM